MPLSTHLTRIGFRCSFAPLNDLFVCERLAHQADAHSSASAPEELHSHLDAHRVVFGLCNTRTALKLHNTVFSCRLLRCHLALALYELVKWFHRSMRVLETAPAHACDRFSFLVPAEGKVLPIAPAPTLKGRSAFKLTNTF